MKHLPIIIITGLSGSGKSSAVDSFEDAGFFCVDNMPVALLPKFLELSSNDNQGKSGFVFVMDLREKVFLSTYSTIFDDLKKQEYQFEIIFFEADEDILLQRYSQSRRHHPLSPEKDLLSGIREERKQFNELRKKANIIINTTNYNVHKLKSVIQNIAKKKINTSKMKIFIESFGFKHGAPQDADLLVDVRFVTNPFFVPELKHFTGENEKVKEFVLNSPETTIFLQKYLELIDFLIPLYISEGKAYLTLAIGCTGGKHRSVVISNYIYEHILKYEKNLDIIHRDIDQL